VYITFTLNFVVLYGVVHVKWESSSVEKLIFVAFILMCLGMIGCRAVNSYSQKLKFNMYSENQVVEAQVAKL
jgi:hypothetical protein